MTTNEPFGNQSVISLITFWTAVFSEIVIVTSDPDYGEIFLACSGDIWACGDDFSA